MRRKKEHSFTWIKSAANKDYKEYRARDLNDLVSIQASVYNAARRYGKEVYIEVENDELIRVWVTSEL